MIGHICYVHSSAVDSCPMCNGRWKTQFQKFSDIFGKHVDSKEVVVGDPTSFRSYRDGFDRGWDLESIQKAKVKYLVEYEQEWQNKMVKNPATGNQVKVGSLLPAEQEKYRPKSDKASPDEPVAASNSGSPDKVSEPKAAGQPGVPEIKKQVDGGIIIKKDMNPADFKEKTGNMTAASSLVSKRWNSKFDVFKDQNEVYHLFHSTYDKEEIDGGATNPERANTIKQIGAFLSADAAKKYVMGGDEKWDLDQSKRTTLAKQTPWGAKGMGI